MKKIIFILGLMTLPHVGVTQSTTAVNLQNGGQNRFVGFNNNFPLYIKTNATPRAIFTTGAPLNCLVGNSGDGLRIINPYPSGVGGNLDLFTSQNSGQNETHIRFGNNGQISGQANRLEIRGYTQLGLWYNTEIASSMHIFAKAGAEQARIGTNNFYRIGENPNNNNAIRRLEVFQKGKAPQFRITANQNSSTFVDFRARNNGNLNILPSGGKVGVNLNSNPTHTMDINGRLRIRQVQTVSSPQSLLIGQQFGGQNSRVVRRLDFTGNANDVLLGDGTWGTVNTFGSGNACGDPANPITNNWEIPLDNYSYNFTTTQPLGRVNVGNLNCNSFFPARLTSEITEIMDSALKEHAAIIGYADGTNFIPNTSQYGVWGAVTKGASIESAGVYGVAINSQNYFGSSLAIGVKGQAIGSNRNVGMYGFSMDPNAHLNVGGNFNANYGTRNIGVYASAGTYTSAPPTSSTANLAGYFDGDVYIAGSFGPSDINMKTNVVDYDSSLYVINLLEPRSFEFTDANFQGMNLPSGHQYGLIAQEVEQILPAIVTDNFYPAEYDTLGNMIHPEYYFKGLDYEQLIPILIGGIKQQQAQIDSLTNASDAKDSIIAAMQTQLNDVDARLAHLESCLSGVLPQLCQMSNSAIQQNDEQAQEELINQIEVILDNSQNIVLEQNVPNPFTEQTTINYFIPENVEKAQIHFYNQMGQLIKTINVTQRGQGRLNVYASDLSTGAYTYTLIADGKAVTTKKMIKE